jgi:hypothetical protein
LRRADRLTIAPRQRLREITRGEQRQSDAHAACF